MNYLFVLKYLPIWKKWKRADTQQTFETRVYTFLKDRPNIRIKQSGCKRYYIDDNLKIIIRMNYRTSYKMGFKQYSQSLENSMNYFVKNDYNIIAIKGDGVNMTPEVEHFINNCSND